MLTLSRHPGESFTLITDDFEILISIDEINGQQVRISFDLPDTVEVWRTELLEKGEGENNNFNG